MREKILSEIDATLDQLIRNAQTLEGADWDHVSEIEIEAFQKTQESLLHHWLDLDQRISTCRPSVLSTKQRRYKKIKIAIDRKIRLVNN